MSFHLAHPLAQFAFELIGSATLYKWVGQYGKIQTPDGELTNNKEIKKLKKELNDLKIENEILKKAMAIFTQK